MSVYQQAFGLSVDPFTMTPDPDLLFLTEQHREALAGLAYAILGRKGFAVFTGPAGTGKTTVVRRFLRSVEAAGVQSSVILNPTLTPAEFLEMALIAFGIAEVPAGKTQRICLLERFLLECQAKGNAAALIIDEAHKLSPEVLEEIRLLSNFELCDQKLLQIVLVGQSELRALLNRHDLQQLKQRIALQFSIVPLSAAEVEPYLQYRWLKAGGGNALPFRPEAIQLIARASCGIPRVMNAISDNALLQAFAGGAAVVAEEPVRAACRDLDLFLDPPPPSAAAPPVAPPAAAKIPAVGDEHSLARALQANTPAAPANGYLLPLRTLAAYDPARRPSWWARWMGRKVPAY